MSCGCEHQNRLPEETRPAAAPSGRYQQRLALCAQCPSLKRWSEGVPLGADVGLMDRCAECGCFMRAKAALGGAACPLGVW